MRVIELSEAVGAEKRALDAIIRRLSSEQFRLRVRDQWTVKDILGHIAAYYEVERLAIEAGLGYPDVHPIYFDNRQQWNEEQRELRRLSPGKIQGELEENAARYIALIKTLHEEDLIKWIRFPWNEEGTLHELIMDGLKHRREHREEIAAAVGQVAAVAP